MNYQSTSSSNRLHIAIFGCRNSGKSTLMNAIIGHEVSVVSDVAGTTTDVVSKAMELRGVGPTLLIDTPGFDDDDLMLGEKRIQQTSKALEKSDMALLVCSTSDLKIESEWANRFNDKNIPFIPIVNVKPELSDIEGYVNAIMNAIGKSPVVVNAFKSENMERLRLAILEAIPQDFDRYSITGSLVSENDTVILVMPQDAQAPKGRLIMPQVQTLRELMDKKAIALCCTPENLQQTLDLMTDPPKLIITDSQVFGLVYPLTPKESMLTSFSVLMAGYKGDIRKFIEGASAIDRLTESSRILIAEACAHAPASEDIGRVKIPMLLRKRIGQNLAIDFVSGSDFPVDLMNYDLIIHCGACMFNRKYVINRLDQAVVQRVTMTNYGVVIAYLNGIIDKIVY